MHRIQKKKIGAPSTGDSGALHSSNGLPQNSRFVDNQCLHAARYFGHRSEVGAVRGSSLARQRQPFCDRLRRLNQYGSRAIPFATTTTNGLPPPTYYLPPPYYGYGYGGYPPPAYYRANPSAPVQGTDRDADGEAYGDEYDGYYPPRPRFGDVPNGSRPVPLGAPPVSPQDRGTAVAALPPEYQREQGPTKEIPPQFRRTVVDYRTVEPSGTIIIDTPSRYLYLTLGNGKAIRYGVGVGREGFTWSGTERISRMKEWPDWVPPKEMIARQPYLPRFMAGGETNPLGARAMYLGNTEYRIHGTNQPSSIGSFVSSGCIRLTNEDGAPSFSCMGNDRRISGLGPKSVGDNKSHHVHKRGDQEDAG